MKLKLVTGSSGFIGTNLVKFLLEKGDSVIGIDNFSSSERWKSRIFEGNENYEFIEGDICENLEDLLKNSSLISKYNQISEIYNLACPASPPRYQKLSLETILVNTKGMRNVLDLARIHNAKILHTSTSEIYGDPLVHPQTEDYRGNVNTVGPRSCYDEGKRISETICYEYKRLFDVDIKIVRIFNTYGPFMDPSDGRVITNFISQALNGKDLTIYGKGAQTRSFQYISDLLRGFEKFMQNDKSIMGPINLGNPAEVTIKELSDFILGKIESKSKLVYKDLPADDPKKRCPDISKAKELLDWSPVIQLDQGLSNTIDYYKELLNGGDFKSFL